MKLIRSIFGVLLVLVIVLGVGYSPVKAEDSYHHIFVADWGSDSSNGTETTPLRSLREAFSRVTPDQQNRIDILGTDFVLDLLLEDPTGNNRPTYRVMSGYQVTLTSPASALPPVGNNNTRVRLLPDPNRPLVGLYFYSKSGRLSLENIDFSNLRLRLQPSQGGSMFLRNIRSYTDSGDTASPVILANSNGGSLIIEDSEIGFTQPPSDYCHNPNSPEYWYRLILYNKGSEDGPDSLWLRNNSFSIPTSLKCYFRVIDTWPAYPNTWIYATGNTFLSTGQHLHDQSVGFYIPDTTPWNDLVADNDFTNFWGEPVVD